MASTLSAIVAKDDRTSARLSRIRQKNTSPELLVRQALHRMGRRFRVGGRGLPGSPDIVNRKARWAIFVHGCFWHHHDRCRKATIPKHNRNFWVAKFKANKARDLQAMQALAADGYRVMTVWECETTKTETLGAVLSCFFSGLDEDDDRRT